MSEHKFEECGLKIDGATCRLPVGHEKAGIVHQLERPEKVPAEYVEAGPMTKKFPSEET